MRSVRSILEIGTWNDSFEGDMHVSVIDTCIESLSREAWGFILFKMEGKQY